MPFRPFHVAVDSAAARGGRKVREAGEGVEHDLPTGLPQSQHGGGVLAVRPADVILVIPADCLDRSPADRMIRPDEIRDALHALHAVQPEVNVVQRARPRLRAVRGRPSRRLNGSPRDGDHVTIAVILAMVSDEAWYEDYVVIDENDHLRRRFP